VKAKVFDRLLYRHWNAFSEFKRSHLFVTSADAVAEARDITPGDHDVPPFNLGGQDMYAISPDGQEVAYTSNMMRSRRRARTTRSSSCRSMAVRRRRFRPRRVAMRRRLFAGRQALAWLSMARGGFEATRRGFHLRRSGQTRDASEGLIAPSQLSLDAGFEAISSREDRGEAPIYALPARREEREIARAAAELLQQRGQDSSLRALRSAPNEIWRIDAPVRRRGRERSRSGHARKEPVLSQIAMQPLERSRSKGARNAECRASWSSRRASTRLRSIR
jgi:hypothetical protein